MNKLPKEGTIGYCYIEEINYNGPEIQPQIFRDAKYEEIKSM